MSSVQGEKKCPKCGGSMFYDFNCNTTEEVRSCLRCGFYQNWFLLRNEDGSVMTKEDGTWLGDYKEKIGYGAVSLKFKKGVGHVYTLTEPVMETEKQAILKQFQQEGIAPDSYAVLFDPATGEFTTLVGKCPPDYEDYVVSAETADEEGA